MGVERKPHSWQQSQSILAAREGQSPNHVGAAVSRTNTTAEGKANSAVRGSHSDVDFCAIPHYRGEFYEIRQVLANSGGSSLCQKCIYAPSRQSHSKTHNVSLSPTLPTFAHLTQPARLRLYKKLSITGACENLLARAPAEPGRIP